MAFDFYGQGNGGGQPAGGGFSLPNNLSQIFGGGTQPNGGQTGGQTSGGGLQGLLGGMLQGGAGGAGGAGGGGLQDFLHRLFPNLNLPGGLGGGGTPQTGGPIPPPSPLPNQTPQQQFPAFRAGSPMPGILQRFGQQCRSFGNRFSR